MDLNVKSSGSTKSFQLKGIEATLTVVELKKKCAEECGLVPEQQRLFFKGKLLKDEDTLQTINVADKATLFLVKGASGEGGAAASSGNSSDAKAQDETEEPTVTVLCSTSGCGFFGTNKTGGLCSKCYSKNQKKEHVGAEKPGKERPDESAGATAPVPAAAASTAEGGGAEEVKGEPEGEAAAGAAQTGTAGVVASGTSESAAASSVPGTEVREEQKDKTKCWLCGKKCGLTGFECRCGYVFCAKHRYAEDHDCAFDHKGRGREILAKNNPNISLGGGGAFLDGA